jgi:hypothetical protein
VAVSITEEQYRILKAHYVRGKTAKETRQLMAIPLGNIQHYYQEFRLSGLSRTSVVQQKLLQAAGTFGKAYTRNIDTEVAA